MNICILRHGTSEPSNMGIPDSDRRLTRGGRRELKAVLKQTRKAGIVPELILTSPLTRALETAEIAESALGCDQVTQTKALLPGVAPEQTWKEIRSHNGLQELMLVGHEPHLSQLAAFLLEAPVALDLKKGSILRLAIQDENGPPKGVVKWMLTPKLAGAK